MISVHEEIENRLHELQKIVFITILVFLNSFQLQPAIASQTINVEKLASAIRKAEGNANYGILKPIKGRNYRKACIQTIHRAQKDYKGHPSGFIAFLGSRYAPLNAENDPHGLNRNWISNVTKIYNHEVNV